MSKLGPLDLSTVLFDEMYVSFDIIVIINIKTITNNNNNNNFLLTKSNLFNLRA